MSLDFVKSGHRLEESFFRPRLEVVMNEINELATSTLTVMLAPLVVLASVHFAHIWRWRWASAVFGDTQPEITSFSYHCRK